MKRWTSTWSALLVTGFLAIPAAALAQTPAATAPPAAMTQEKTAQGTPQDHLKQADVALNSIAPTAATGKAKSQIADLKKHITALETIAANSNDAKNAAKWSKEAAAADKILGELLAGDASTTGSTSASATTAEPRPAGTSGTSASKTVVALDADTKGKLTTVRTHLTAFAVAMSGSAAAPAPKTSEPSSAAAATAPASTTPADPSAPAAPTSAPASPSPATPAEPTPASPAQPAPTSPAQPAPTSPAQPAMPPTEPSPAAPTSQPPTQPAHPSEPAAQPPASAGQAPTDPAAASNVNADAAKTALTAARDSLSQMTQLPAAQQLSGDSRTQVTQLIANFNELITTKADWKASFAKVDANVTALIGAETEASAAAPAATAAAPTTGAVGTSGATATTMDAAVKAKLVEFRNHLKEFQKAAGAADQK